MADFLVLLHTVQSIRTLIVLDAKTDHEEMVVISGDNPDSFTIDFAKLLGMTSDNLVVTFKAPNASTVYRITENALALFKQYRPQYGWPESLCRDVAMLSSCHIDPMPPHGHAMAELYLAIIENRYAFGLWSYLIERLSRAWPYVARPEMIVEINIVDHRRQTVEIANRLNDESDDDAIVDFEKRRARDQVIIDSLSEEQQFVNDLIEENNIIAFDSQTPN